MIEGISDWVDQHLLTTLIFLPILSLLLPMGIEILGARLSATTWRAFAFGASILDCGLSFEVWSRFARSSYR